ncbi:MAG: pantoate--beta-alanine ligase [Chitinophagales bacterium]|nr:pantoate--beta-alanine ligase [Chitinophagales bacterium]
MIKYKHSTFLLQFVKRQKADNKTIGFVPTMGALHAGHISLIKKAKEMCDIVVCSIFVNPTQFNNKEDLEKYPRTLDKDLQLLQEAACDIVFIPTVKEMYPKGLNETFEAPLKGSITNVLEGEHRPGHFEGMMQVVSKLLDKVQPTHLFMGLKDYQQLTIVKHMLKAQKRSVVLVPIEIMREKHGLAMSSRNERLKKEARLKADFIYKTLLWVKENKQKYANKDLEKKATEMLKKHTKEDVEYCSIVNADTLLPTDSKENTIVLTALWYGGVRLIDNMIL